MLIILKQFEREIGNEVYETSKRLSLLYISYQHNIKIKFDSLGKNEKRFCLTNCQKAFLKEWNLNTNLLTYANDTFLQA